MQQSGTDSAQVLFTFRENPLVVLRNKPFIGNLSLYPQKIVYLRKLHIHTVVMIDFSTDISKLKGTEFLQIIFQNIRLRYLVIGNNFTCGYKADTNAEKIQQFLNRKEVNVRIMKPVTYKGIPVSSTRIRQTVLQGDLISVNKMLGKKYCLEFPNGVSSQEDRNIRILRNTIKQVIPESGEYLVDLVNGREKKHSIITIQGNNISWQQPKYFNTEKILFTEQYKKE